MPNNEPPDLLEAQQRTSPQPDLKRPSIDREKYRAELSGLKLTEQQEDELLGIIWSIMASFVQLGFDVKICGQILESFAEAAHNDSDSVQSSNSRKTEKPSGETRKEIDS